MSNITARRRGRHSAAPVHTPAITPLLARPPALSRDGARLPGMELLGFYDEPYHVAVNRPPQPRRASAIVAAPRPASGPLGHSARVEALWETTQVDESALERWKPQVMGRRRLGGRRIRMSSLLAAMAAICGLVFVGVAALQRPARLAEQSLQTLRADTRVLLESLTPVEDIVASMGATDAPDLSASTQRIMAAETAARRVFSDAGTLTDPLRASATTAAGGILEVTARTNRLLAYRLATERSLRVPDLPSSPGEADLPAVTEQVASWRAETETALAGLAPDVLPAHRSAVEMWASSLDRWQAGYLDAIRQEDPEAMASSLEDLQNQIEDLRRALLDELAEAGGELRALLADSRRVSEGLLAD